MPTLPTHLETILARTRTDLRARQQAMPRVVLERAAAEHTPRGFASTLARRGLSGPAIIAELKKASPSKGLIRADFSASQLAIAMEAAGASALSVLTDEPFFQGSLANLRDASAATRLPCLRKDFIVDEYQIVEARAWGADAVLLIAAALTDDELEQLNRCAQSYALDVLCEVHTRAEAERVAGLGCAMVGVNNRDLHTFAVRIETALELAGHLPHGALLVAESGIRQPADYARLHAAGYRAFLIGETFMRAPDPGAALSLWMEQAAAELVATSSTHAART